MYQNEQWVLLYGPVACVFLKGTAGYLYARKYYKQQKKYFSL